MYAIINTKTKKFVYGTDYRNLIESPRGDYYRQKTSHDQAITYRNKDLALIEFHERKCASSYQVVRVKIEILQE